MRLRLFVLFACAPLAGLCFGQKPGDAVPMKGNPKVTELTVKMRIVPATMPKPALKYALLPTYPDLVPADALGSYLKSFAEQSQLYFTKEGAEKFEKYSPKDPADLPADAHEFGWQPLRNADAAARMDRIDWLSVTPLKRDGTNTLLPEIQQMRRLGFALTIRCRGEVKAGKFREATETAQSIFGLARHLDQHPTMIGGLVATAIASMAMQPLEEFARQPGSPNLFWAYANLPEPLVEYRRGIEYERNMLKFELAEYVDREVVWDEDRTRRAKKKLDELLPNLDSYLITSERGQPVLKWFRDRAKDPSWVAGCRKRLTEAGYDASKVARYPTEQAVLADVFAKAEILRDEYFKYAFLPNPQFEAMNFKLPEVKEGDDLAVNFFVNAIGFVDRWRAAQMRLRQRLALLQTVEALREYAALNGGKLPAALADIKLPLPKDPVNEKAFEYAISDGKATLKGAIPKSVWEQGGQRVVYEIQVRK